MTVDARLRQAIDIALEVEKEPTAAAQLAKLQDLVAAIDDPDDRRIIETYLSIRERIITLVDLKSQSKDRRAAGISALVGVAVILLVAIFVPKPTESQERAFVIVDAIIFGAAGFFLPGSIAVESKRPGLAVKAAGAIGAAVFIVLIYKFIL